MAQLPQQDIGELQLRLELRRRFPDVNLASIIKVMKLGSPNIKHNEATCTSTFQHSIRSSLSPCAPPKPNLSAKLETGTDVLFGPTGNAAMQSRLVIDPSNCGMSEAPTTPVLHPEASPLDCFDTNTYCADLSYKPSAGSLLSPVDANCHTRDVRQPTRVVNYQGYSGGTVTLMPPACDTSQHQFKVVHLDGRGTVLPVPSRSIQTPATPLSCTVACSTLSSAFQQCFAGQARHVDVHGKVLGTVTTRVTRGIIGCSKSDEAVDSVCNGQGNHMLLNLPQTDKLGLLSPNRQQHLSMVCSYTSRPPGVDVIGRQDNVFGAAYRCRPTHVSPHRSRSVEPRCVGGRDWIGCNVQPGHAVGTSVSGAQYRTHSLAGSVAVGINQGDMIPSCVLSPTVHQILHNAPLNSSQVSVGATLYGMAQIKGHGSFESSNRLLETVGNGHGYVADTASFSSPLVHHGSSGAFPFISRSSSHSSLSSDSAFLTPPDLTAVLPRRWSGNIQEEDAYITELLYHQRLHLDKLSEDVSIKRHYVRKLSEDVNAAEQTMMLQTEMKPPALLVSVEDIACLRDSNRWLQTAIQMYLNEIDNYRTGQGLTSPEPVPKSPERISPLPSRVNRNDLNTIVPAPSATHVQGGGCGDSEEGERWSCSACTFENHPALKKCEMCEMSRVVAD